MNKSNQTPDVNVKRVCIVLILCLLVFSINAHTALSLSILSQNVIAESSMANIQITTDQDADVVILDGTTELAKSTNKKVHDITLDDLAPNEQYSFIAKATSGTESTQSNIQFSTQHKVYTDIDFEPMSSIPSFVGSTRFSLKGKTVPQATATAYVDGIISSVATADTQGIFELKSIKLADTDQSQNVRIEIDYLELPKYVRSFDVSIDSVSPVVTFSPIPEVTTDHAIDVSITTNEPITLVQNVNGEESEDIITSESTVSLSLEEGQNSITLRAYDKANNSIVVSKTVFADTEKPRIEYTNINDLSPAYSSFVTIRGRVSEPGAQVRVYVNPEQKFLSECSDGIDNDGDGLVDYLADPGCFSPSSYRENEEDLYEQLVSNKPACFNDEDDDGDGYIDFLDDPGCDDAGDTDELDYSATTTECNDGKDNDGDNRVDYLEDKGCTSLDDNSENSEGAGDFSETVGDAEGNFEIPIALDFAFTTFTDAGVRVYDSQTAQPDSVTTNMGADLQKTGPTNDIRIVVTDKAGNMDEKQGTIRTAHCGSGGDYYVEVTDIYPGMIHPDNLMRGYGEISFGLKYHTLGVDDANIRSVHLKSRRLSREDSAKFDPSSILSPSSCIVEPRSNIDDQVYVVCPLDAYPPERIRNITGAYETLEDMEAFTFPLEIYTMYSVPSEDGSVTTKSHIQCLDLKIHIDQRIPPSLAPKGLLNTSVRVLESAVNGIDQVLKPINNAKMVTLGACLGGQLVNFFKFYQETSACFGVDTTKQENVEAALNGCVDLENCPQVTSACSGGQGSSSADCQTCADSIKSRISFSRKLTYVCDRVFCPKVPSAQHYIEEMEQSSTSACRRYPESPHGLPPAVTTATFDPSQPGCAAEYQAEWKTACLIGFNPTKESISLFENENSEGGFSLRKTLRNLNFCKAADQQSEVGEQFSDKGHTFAQKVQNGQAQQNCYELASRQEVASFDAKSRNVKQDTQVAKVARVTVTDLDKEKTVTNCVETNSVDGKLMFRPAADTAGNPLEYDSATAKPTRAVTYKLNGGSYTPQESDSALTLSADKNMAVDPAGNYYKLNGGKYHKIDEYSTSTQKDLDEFRPEKNFKYACQKPGTNDYQVYTDASQANGCERINGPQKLKGKQVDDFLIDPTYGFINSFRCVCLPAMEAHLQVIREVLNNIKNCFLSLLISNETTAGACRAILTQYICDWIFNAIRCFVNSVSFNTNTSEGNERSTTNIVSNIKGASQKIAKSVKGRYGDTASYTALFSQRKLLYSICLAAFGYDWEPDLDAALSLRGNYGVKSVVEFTVAERSILRINPNNKEGVVFDYKIGYFITAGSDLTYDINFVCSSDNSCDPADGYAETGECDCMNPSIGGEKVERVSGGAVKAGQSVGFGDGRGDEHYKKAGVRYDKVFITYRTKIGDSTIINGTDRVPINHRGSDIPTTCRLNLFPSPRFVCGEQQSYEYGTAYFTSDRGFYTNSQALSYFLDDRFSVFVEAKQDFFDPEKDDTIDSYKQIPKFARLQILDESGQIISSFTDVSIKNELATTPLQLGETVDFTKLANGVSGKYSASPITPFSGGTVLPIGVLPQSNIEGTLYLIKAANPASPPGNYYYYFDSQNALQSDDGTFPTQLQNAMTEFAGKNPSPPSPAIVKVKARNTHEFEVPLSHTTAQTNANQISLNIGATNFIVQITGAAEMKTNGQSAIISFSNLVQQSNDYCSGKPSINLIARVSLVDGVSPDESDVTMNNAVAGKVPIVYNGQIQQKDITFTLYCYARGQQPATPDGTQNEGMPMCSNTMITNKNSYTPGNACYCEAAGTDVFTTPGYNSIFCYRDTATNTNTLYKVCDKTGDSGCLCATTASIASIKYSKAEIDKKQCNTNQICNLDKSTCEPPKP